jgi:hypothetical protein
MLIKQTLRSFSVFKYLLTAASAIAFSFVGAMGLPAQAQPPTLMAQAGISNAASISSQELEQFATAIEQLLVLEQTAQQRIASAIENQGFSRERFGQIYKAQTDSTVTPDPAISADEQLRFETVVETAMEIQEEVQQQKQQAVQNQGLDLDRFNEILTAVQEDEALQQQVEQMLQQ